MRGETWYEADPKRLALEQALLTEPWSLSQQEDGRMAWEGGSLIVRDIQGNKTPEQPICLIYPEGFPARFIEVRLLPDPPEEYWGRYLAHVNADGSACYITAEGWRPYDTVQDAMKLMKAWWWNYHWSRHFKVWGHWPSDGSKLDLVRFRAPRNRQRSPRIYS